VDATSINPESRLVGRKGFITRLAHHLFIAALVFAVAGSTASVGTAADKLVKFKVEWTGGRGAKEQESLMKEV
jgi:hypothetical protein